VTFANFVCVTCRDHPGDECSDGCGLEIPELLPPMWFELQCECCGAELHLVSVLKPTAR
jgi:hypothetical protein